MDTDSSSFAARIGAIVSLLLAAVVFVPALVVTAPGTGVGDYYASGPLGVSIVGFLALLGVVVFLAGAQERSDPVTLSGIALVSGLAMLLFSLLWAVSIDQTLLFSFPAEYAWMENHRWAVVAVALVVAATGGGYARTVLNP
ncbi:DUF7548 family protein [Halobellus ordinarius]|uniref:DUF7548 family protein n=1 Tax=Halobellus ordinarius TaxID=3075120 RepID=UPI00288003B0|nr:hypothetical protein [Halobellus sp. ZY16]